VGRFSRRLERWEAYEQREMDAAAGRYSRRGQSGIELVATGPGDLAPKVPPPQLVIDHVEPVRASWGTTFHPAQPGGHELLIFHRFFHWWTGGEASIRVNVPPDGIVSVEYRASFPAWRNGRAYLRH
jgi:hypothetical protein